jgi:hypothetical protein
LAFRVEITPIWQEFRPNAVSLNNSSRRNLIGGVFCEAEAGNAFARVNLAGRSRKCLS